MLVDYSDSDSDSETDQRLSNNQEQCKAGIIGSGGKHGIEDAIGRPPVYDDPPPLPLSFHSLYATNARKSVADDPELHGGRTRQVPHVEGNWQTHVYLEWSPTGVELNGLTEIVSQVQKQSVELSGLASNRSVRKVTGLLRSALGVPLPLHISLSVPLVLKKDQRGIFQDLYESALARSSVKSFAVSPIALDWASNYDQTRWFLVLRLTKPENDELNNLLTLSNDCVGAFGLSPLYEAPKRVSSLRKSGDAEEKLDYTSTFHISIAWSLQEPSNLEMEAVKKTALGKLKEIQIRFDRVRLKVGNAIQTAAFSQG